MKLFRLGSAATTPTSHDDTKHSDGPNAKNPHSSAAHSVSYELGGAVATHAAAADPHAGYQVESEKGAVSGYASLDAGTKVPTVQLGGAGADATKFLRGDQSWQVPAGGSGGHTIREQGVDLTARTGLNFIDANAGVGLITDDAGGDETEVNLNLYVLRGVGRAGGTTLYGGSAANENLILGGTSHATHTTSIISMLDHVQMASTKAIKDSGGTSRYLVATATPHNTLTGDTRIGVSTGAWTSIGTGAVLAGTILRVHGSNTGGDLVGIELMAAGSISHTVDGLTTIGLKSQPQVGLAAGVVVATVRGLHFVPSFSSVGAGSGWTEATAVYATYLVAGLSGTVAEFNGVKLDSPSIFSGTPTFTLVRGVYVANLGNSSTTDVIGMDIATQSAATGIILGLRLNANAMELSEMTAPAAPAANGCRIYAKDNGAGKTQLMALFSSGAAQQIAIQP